MMPRSLFKKMFAMQRNYVLLVMVLFACSSCGMLLGSGASNQNTIDYSYDNGPRVVFEEYSSDLVFENNTGNLAFHIENKGRATIENPHVFIFSQSGPFTLEADADLREPWTKTEQLERNVKIHYNEELEGASEYLPQGSRSQIADVTIKTSSVYGSGTKVAAKAIARLCYEYETTVELQDFCIGAVRGDNACPESQSLRFTSDQGAPLAITSATQRLVPAGDDGVHMTVSIELKNLHSNGVILAKENVPSCEVLQQTTLPFTFTVSDRSFSSTAQNQTEGITCVPQQIIAQDMMKITCQTTTPLPAGQATPSIGTLSFSYGYRIDASYDFEIESIEQIT